MFDTYDTMTNWQGVTNSTLRIGDTVREGDVSYRITGFGPYFFWGLSSKTGKELRLPGSLLT